MRTDAKPIALPILLSALLITGVSACNEQPQPVAQPADAHADCPPDAAANLLKNPQFAVAGDNAAPDHWQLSQHAGALAYEVSAEQGALTIAKTGEQHWMLVSQSVDPEPLAGDSAVFSVELKQNMTDSGWTQALEPGGGLSITIRGTESDNPLRQKILFSSNLQHEPKLGVFDWTPVSVEFEVPAGVTGIEVGFLHQAYGEMSVRNPALRLSSGTSPACQ